MPTTTYIDAAASVRGIGARTDAAGGAVDDITAEEERLAHAILTEGALTTNAFKVAAVSGMNVAVGSGTAKADHFVVAGEVAGQENYIVRLDVTTAAVTVPAADASLARIDEVYLIVADAPYDGGSLSLFRIGYRKGDAGGAAPGPDAAWKASAKLATIAVGAAVTSITAGNITDNRATAAITVPVTAAQLGARNLADFADVAATAPAAGDVLKWNGTAWAPGSQAVTKATRTSGYIAVNSASFADIDNTLDLTLPAAVGDEIGVAVLGKWGAEAFTGKLDAVVRVSGADVRYISSSTITPAGIPPWEGAPGVVAPISGEWLYTVQSGDLSGGNITFRFRGQAASARTLEASTTTPLRVQATNFG